MLSRGGLISLFVLVASHSSISAQIRVIDAGAIPFTGFLTKADFDLRYPGKSVASAAELDSGWYVTYKHEVLQYSFGPIALESTGQDYLKQLEGIVAEAVVERPSIRDYTVTLSYEPSQLAPSAPSGGTAPSSGSAGSSPPPQSGGWGLFDFIRRIFGG